MYVMWNFGDILSWCDTYQLTYWTDPLFGVPKTVAETASLCVALRCGALATTFRRIPLGKYDPEVLDVHGIMILKCFLNRFEFDRSMA